VRQRSEEAEIRDKRDKRSGTGNEKIRDKNQVLFSLVSDL